MLVIRAEQMEVFRGPTRERFADRLAPQLRRELPKQTQEMDDESLRSLIQSGLKKAEGYGIETEWDLCRFVMYQLRIGPGFDRDPAERWASEILTDADDRKMDRMDDMYFFVLKRS